MANYASGSRDSSTVPSLDFFSFSNPESNQTESNQNTAEFAFDPIPTASPYPKCESQYTQDKTSNLSSIQGWPFIGMDETKPHLSTATNSVHANQWTGFQTHLSKPRSHPSAMLSMFGQVTPPRSNSTSSIDILMEERSISPRAARKQKDKVQGKEPQAPTTSKPTRKRKPRKSTTSTALSTQAPEIERRRESLEKNRMAAAKCRVNKKEKTEQLQQKSHELATSNAVLEQTVSRLRAEIDHMNNILLAHVNTEGCSKPGDIQNHLHSVSTTFFESQHAEETAQPYGTYRSAPEHMQQVSREQIEQGDYFCNAMSNSHPPLPEYNQPGDFDVNTPLGGDCSATIGQTKGFD